MRKLKTEVFTQQLLNGLAYVQVLKKRHKDYKYFPALETHLSSAEKLFHELTLLQKTENETNSKRNL